MTDHMLFLNRELSWLNFNWRVLQEAADTTKPLLERLKFIAITASNLDEFFMIRVGGLKQQLDSDVTARDVSGITADEQLLRISEVTHHLVRRQYRYLDRLLEELREYRLWFCQAEDLGPNDHEWLQNYFRHQVYPVLTPLAVDISHPFPFLANRTLNLAVMVSRSGAEDQEIAVVQIPAVLPRIVELPQKDGIRRFMFLEDIICTYCDQLFCGCMLHDMLLFRITRNADFSIDEDEAEDLLVEVERGLHQRKRGQAVRVEFSKNGSKKLKKFLTHVFMVPDRTVYEIPGPIDATCFMRFAGITDAEDLRYEPLLVQTPADLIGQEDLFAAVRTRDILVHHPYESFQPVLDFVAQAACDPAVLAIKQTLYRVSGNSPIVRALAQAAENGKQVTVLVELKARFDEENNILWARKLEEAGCHVIYGLVGLKTHAKICLVVRREAGGIKRYVHMATGNYNDMTATLYTDVGLFTANDQFGADASGFFNMLSGYSDPPVWNKIVAAPLNLREKIYSLIDRQIELAQQGIECRLIAKMNALLDPGVIGKLYLASTAGVKISLVVRGICVLRPGIPGVSDNITVRSIVGRFLEHSRIFYFNNGGEEKMFLSSADWMPRNLDKRVELFFPVDDRRHVERLKGILELMLRDNCKAHVMRSNGTYRRPHRRADVVNSQEQLIERAQQIVCHDSKNWHEQLKPVMHKP